MEKIGNVVRVPHPAVEADHFRNSVAEALTALVPLRVWELRDASEAEIAKLSEEATVTIAGKADVFQYKTKGDKPSGVLPALVTAFAVLARVEGGITALGVHACVETHEGCPGVGG